MRQTVRIARVGLHFYEEPPISGEKGSGTVFFSGCRLNCVYCQNYNISRRGHGVNVSGGELIKLMKYLVNEGAHNINFVTPSAWTKRLIPILKEAKNTVKVPFVWNCSGNESVEELRELKGLVDVYLPDFKYADDKLAKEYSGVDGYREAARAALKEMRAQQPDDVFEDGIMQRGVIVRHLVLPAAAKNTRLVLKDIAAVDSSLYVSLMGQYFPAGAATGHPTLGRRVSEEEYDDATEAFFDAGLYNGFAQSLDSATEDYVPDFDEAALRHLISSLK